MSEKESFGALSVVAGFICLSGYLWAVFKGHVRPHVFSWVVWTLLLGIGFAVQVSEGAGPGSWALGSAMIMNAAIAMASYFHGERNITKGDWICFIGALSAIPAWLATEDPLAAAVIVSVIDAVAFYPTFRKAWVKPQEESSFAFAVMSVQIILSLYAMENVAITTVLYPAVILFLNIAFIIMLLWRRRALSG
jgi:hypothetical protein